jgi:hypothetical protein
MKATQNGAPVFCRYAGAVIAYLDADAVAAGEDTDCHPAAGRRVLDRIVYQIADRLEQQVRIPGDLGRPPLSARRCRRRCCSTARARSANEILRLAFGHRRRARDVCLDTLLAVLEPQPDGVVESIAGVPAYLREQS